MDHILDHLARGLGAATSRRDAIRLLGGFVGTSALAFAGVGSPAHARTGRAAGTARPNVCDVLPEGLPFCSDSGGCQCVDTAGGARSCAELVFGLCDTPACDTDAECAGLGAGAFCGYSAYDDPFCDDGRGRCMVPCGHTNVGGTWSGVSSLNGQEIPVRFELVDHEGDLRGRVHIADPVNGQFIDIGTLSGQRSTIVNDDDRVIAASWRTATGVFVGGTFAGTAFEGTLRFSPVNGHGEEFEAEVRLTRTSGPTADDPPAPGHASASPVALQAPHPNPARAGSAVTVPVNVAVPVSVRVVVYDARGRELSVLHDGPLGVGLHPLRWDGGALPAGTYAVRAVAGAASVTRMVTLVP
jgi:hypothetical protein